MRVPTRFRLAAILAAIGLALGLVVAVVAQQPPAPAPSHSHPDLVTRLELWKAAATIIFGYVAIAVVAGYRVGRRDEQLEGLVEGKGEHSETIDVLQREVAVVAAKQELILEALRAART